MKVWINFLRSRLKEKAIKNPKASTFSSESKNSPTTLEPTTEAYSADRPISTKEQDRFGRWPFSKRIADTIANRADPSSLVVGLYGPWGDGKTSALQLMEEVLAQYPKVVVIRFNPWLFGSEQQLLKGFFTTLSDGLGRSLSTWSESLGEVLKKYGSVLSLASISVASGVELSGGSAAAGLGEALSSVELDALKARVEKFLEEEKTRVVVLIDDIDRLDRAEIHAIFKLVKLSASFYYTSYVLAFDDEMVSAALGEKYGAGGQTAGRNFLEKIIQVPLHLPPADQIELRRLALDGVEVALSLSGIELSEDQVQAFIRHFVDGLEPKLETPRQAKLFANALAFALPLLKGEANPVDLMLMEGVRVFYPKLYATIRDNPEMFLNAQREGGQRDDRQGRLTELISGALEDSGIIDKDRVRRGLIKPLFPRTENVSYGHEWDAVWGKEQHICSSEYFRRFFTYSVPPGDVGDQEVSSFIDSLSRDEAASVQVDDQLNAFSARRAIPRLITRLRVLADSMERNIAHVLAVSLARNGALLPNEQGVFSIGGTRMQGAILISQLLKRTPPGTERADLAKAILRAAAPLPFAAECSRWIRRSSDEAPERQILSEEANAEVGRVLADRIFEQASREPLYRSFKEDVPHLFWIWANSRGNTEVSECIRRWLNAEGDGVNSLLDSYVGRAWGMETGLSHRADFRRESYNSIAGIVDPAFVFDKLRERHGADLNNPEYHQDHGTAPQLQTARQYAFIHLAVLEEQRLAKEAEDVVNEAIPPEQP